MPRKKIERAKPVRVTVYLSPVQPLEAAIHRRFEEENAVRSGRGQEWLRGLLMRAFQQEGGAPVEPDHGPVAQVDTTAGGENEEAVTVAVPKAIEVSVAAVLAKTVEQPAPVVPQPPAGSSGSSLFPSQEEIAAEAGGGLADFDLMG
ncbi:hypothetical protein [Roseomonas genomospecies 6]|nr:hypothetical protein [Roseomonas genomospecies 6]